MTWTGAIVLFAVIWWIIFLVIVPRGAQSQAEVGEIEPGTPASAPASVNVPRKAIWATVATVIVLGVLAGIMESGVITLNDFDFLYPESFSRVVTEPVSQD